MKMRLITISGSPRTIQVTTSLSHKCTQSPDGLTIMGYDHAVTQWLNAGRVGPRPQRQVRRAA
jgi:hypothetical protein